MARALVWSIEGTGEYEHPFRVTGPYLDPHAPAVRVVPMDAYVVLREHRDTWHELAQEYQRLWRALDHEIEMAEALSNPE